ncbi:hypothetical protein FRC04_007401 [Tulasnella sp. 424]|nr:hypothetical protein FRC04_007401 [Tulasnella sp. 424]KAG8962693.1 hypothetical protein FRC05_005149 [Tulasnella sp. 425]
MFAHPNVLTTSIHLASIFRPSSAGLSAIPAARQTFLRSGRGTPELPSLHKFASKHRRSITPGPPARSLWLVLSQREERECPRYMYHGKMDVIERTLREGQVSSEGRVSRLARRREAVFGQVVEELEARGGASAAAEDDEEDEDNDENDDQGGGRRAYPYPNTKDLNMGVDGDDSSGVGDWAERASGNASGGELVDDMAGFLDRF